MGDWPQAEKAQLLLQSVGFELAADLDQDPFFAPPREAGFGAREADSLILICHRVHLDLLPLGIEPRVIAHRSEIEIAVEQSVDIAEHIQNERRGNASTIVVGRF